jgi:uncharacterized protein YciI
MAPERLQFIYTLSPTDPAKAASREGWTEYDHETFDLHWANLEQALDDGKLVLAGRSQDADGTGPAIVIFEADSEEEARRFFEAEPFVTRGFATATLHPFRVALTRGEADG